MWIKEVRANLPPESEWGKFECAIRHPLNAEKRGEAEFAWGYERG